MRLSSVKTQLIIFLAAFAVFLSIKDRDILFILTTLISVISAAGTETIILYFKNKKFEISESSLISGLIIGHVLYSKELWWIPVFCAIAAISSKYLLTIKGRHLFNPAAFGIFLAIVLFGADTQWKGTYLWYILVPAGLYFITKIRKLEVVGGYFAISLLLFGTQAVMQKGSLSNIFGYFSYYYIFIMLIEPKTTPVKPLAKLIFGAVTAAVVFVLTERAVKFDAELCSLLISNMLVPLLNKLP